MPHCSTLCLMHNVLSDTLKLAPSKVPRGPFNYEKWSGLFTQRGDERIFSTKDGYMNTHTHPLMWLISHPCVKSRAHGLSSNMFFVVLQQQKHVVFSRHLEPKSFPLSAILPVVCLHTQIHTHAHTHALTYTHTVYSTCSVRLC